MCKLWRPKGFCKRFKIAVNEETALNHLLEVKAQWGNKYPSATKSWENHWDSLSTLFMFPPETRKIMYTTNVIESLNSQYRKVTKTKLIFPTGKISLVLDHARIHHSKLIKPFLKENESRLELVFLPSYSPELNPIEGLWALPTPGLRNIFLIS